MTDNRITKTLRDTPQVKWQRAMLLSSLANGREATPAEWYEMLDMYYLNNGLYDALAAVMRNEGLWMENMKPLRNPANRAVEFHVSHLWPGALPQAMPLIAKEPVIEAIQKVWDWSNWGEIKQPAARKYASLGDMFIKVPTHKNTQGEVTQVILQVLCAQDVIDFKKDERKFITFIRIDTPQIREADGKIDAFIRTEVWNKDDGSYKIYEHKKDIGTDIKLLGSPTISKSITDAFGIDFIPIVHAMFRDVGERRGAGCFVHALDKIDEANRMSTRLHQMLFRYNKALMAVTANAADAQGRPLPPPHLADRNGNDDQNTSYVQGDDDLLELPGFSKVEYLVPNVKYADALAILQDHMSELEYDLPEIAYYDLQDKGQLSGKAFRTMLSGAIDRAIEARGNGETALIRAQQMALTIGQLHNLPGFEATTIGTFENGDFAHSFVERDVIPVEKQEQAEIFRAFTGGGMPTQSAAKQAGLSKTEIDEMTAEEDANRNKEQASLGQTLLEMQRQRDQGKTK